MHGVCEFGVTGELLADPGTLVAEVIMIVIIISMMYLVYETPTSLQKLSILDNIQIFRAVVGCLQFVGEELTGVGSLPPGLVANHCNQNHHCPVFQ